MIRFDSTKLLLMIKKECVHCVVQNDQLNSTFAWFRHLPNSNELIVGVRLCCDKFRHTHYFWILSNSRTMSCTSPHLSLSVGLETVRNHAIRYCLSSSLRIISNYCVRTDILLNFNEALLLPRLELSLVGRSLSFGRNNRGSIRRELVERISRFCFRA